MELATLPTLLWAVLGALERAYIDEGAGVGPMPSLDQWANLIRVIGSAGTDLRELPAMVRCPNGLCDQGYLPRLDTDSWKRLNQVAVKPLCG